MKDLSFVKEGVCVNTTIYELVGNLLGGPSLGKPALQARIMEAFQCSGVPERFDADYLDKLGNRTLTQMCDTMTELNGQNVTHVYKMEHHNFVMQVLARFKLIDMLLVLPNYPHMVGKMVAISDRTLDGVDFGDGKEHYAFSHKCDWGDFKYGVVEKSRLKEVTDKRAGYFLGGEAYIKRNVKKVLTDI